MKLHAISLCDLTGNTLLPWAEAGYECWAVDLQHPAGVTAHALDARIKAVGMDIMSGLLDELVGTLRGRTAVMFSAPPCTDLTGSGARWWGSKGPEAYRDAMALVMRCAWAGEALGCPWFIENPVGRINTGAAGGRFSSLKWRDWDHRFQPWEFGGWDGEGEKFWKEDGAKLWRAFSSSTRRLPEAVMAKGFTDWCRMIRRMPGEPNDGYHKSTCLWCGGGFRMPEKRPIPLNSRPDFIHRCPPGKERANIRSVTPMGFARAVFAANCR
jgi:hypothetical protein